MQHGTTCLSARQTLKRCMHLHWSLTEELYMHIPKDVDDGPHSGKVPKPDRALYHLKEDKRPLQPLHPRYTRGPRLHAGKVGRLRTSKASCCVCATPDFVQLRRLCRQSLDASLARGPTSTARPSDFGTSELSDCSCMPCSRLNLVLRSWQLQRSLPETGQLAFCSCHTYP